VTPAFLSLRPLRPSALTKAIRRRAHLPVEPLVCSSASRGICATDVPVPAGARVAITRRPDSVGAFEFVILSSLRAAQLMRGCTPKVEGAHKMTTTAQWEVAAGMISNVSNGSAALPPLVAASASAPAVVAV
jgi:hypothetical protein